MKGSAFLFKTLYDLGVRDLFALFGRELEYIHEDDLNLFSVFTFHHEQNAIIAAEAKARMTHEPQVALVTLGPGITNSMTGVASAFYEKSPIVLIGFQVEFDLLSPETHQYVDDVALMSPISKKVYVPKNLNELAIHLKEALMMSLTPPYGPVFISLSIDLLKEKLSSAPETLRFIKPERKLSPYPQDLMDKINKSKAPLLFLGGDVLRYGNIPKLKEAIELSHIPFATSLTAKGIIDESHGLSLGVFSRYLEKFYGIHLKEWVSRHFDLVVLIGFDKSEGLLVSDFIDCERVDICYVDGRSDLTLNLPMSKSAEEIVRNFRASKVNKNSHQISPYLFNVCDEIKKVMSQNDKFVCDVGIHKHLASLTFNASGPLQYIGSNSLATMGFGLPAAIGVALSCPSQRIFVFCGDGGFLSCMGEIETIKRLKLNITIVVLNNQKFHLINIYHRFASPESKETVTAFSEVDYSKVAASVGMNYAEACNLDTLKTALEKASSVNGPFLLNLIG